MLVKAQDIMKSLEQGIKEYGVLVFYEKGAPAIMDFSTTMNKIRSMTMNDINMLFRELCSLGHVGEQFVYNAMIAMTDFFSSDSLNKSDKDSSSINNNPITKKGINKDRITNNTSIISKINSYHQEVLSNSRQTSSYIKDDTNHINNFNTININELEQISIQHQEMMVNTGIKEVTKNSINLNAPTHNTDNILRVLQISQKHFELA